VIPVRRDRKDPLELPDLREKLVPLGLRATLALRVRKAWLAPKGLRVLLGLKGMPVLRVPLVRKGHRVFKAILVQPVRKDRLVLLERLTT
jgi:hypothetical protein